MLISRILVPTDFSPDAAAALAYALQLAAPFQATVHLLHVVENPLVGGMWAPDVYTPAIAGLQATLVRDARKRLRASIPTIAGVRVGVTREVRTGNPARVIADVAGERLSSVIVMGTRGRSGLPRALAGSVAERVMRLAPCPVLTLPAHAATEPKTADAQTSVSA